MDSKHCPRCKTAKSVDQFGESKARKDGLQAYCSDCMKKYRLEHYYGNKQQYYGRNDKTRAQLRQLVVDLKESGSCEECGVTYPGEPWMFEYDHRVASTKAGSIGHITTRGSKRLLLEKLDKCDLLCLVCHRRRTAERGNWKVNRLSHLL